MMYEWHTAAGKDLLANQLNHNKATIKLNVIGEVFKLYSERGGERKGKNGS